MKFALFGNTFQSDKSAHVRHCVETLRKHGNRIAVDGLFMRFLQKKVGLNFTPDEVIDSDCFTADMVLSMGGDGTFLETARRVGAKAIPILGVNTGRLGFLADSENGTIEETVRALCEGRYNVEQRSVLAVTSEGDTIQGYPFALNDIAVLKRDNSSMIAIRMEVDGQPMNTYQADGLIISTPTGSTGYAMSVGGPIMDPQRATVGITPVAPHSLNVRPVVLRDDIAIDLKVISRTHHYLLSVDGRSEVMNEATALKIRKANYTIGIVRVSGLSFFDTLRHKLSWGTDPRN